MKQKTYLRENLIEIAFTEFKKNNPHCPEDLSKKYATSKVDILLGYEKEEERTTVTPEPKQEIEFITAEEARSISQKNKPLSGDLITIFNEIKSTALEGDTELTILKAFLNSEELNYIHGKGFTLTYQESQVTISW